jgi:LysM repeat protein
VKYWLNLALSALALGAVISAGVIAPVSGPTPAFAVDEAAAPVITQAATNGSLWAGSDAAGNLYWSEDSGSTWSAGNLSLTKSGVSSLIWSGSSFLATSYFEGARSSDGKTWTRFMLPLGSAFDPGNIISDEEFFRSGSMSVEQIQAFLNQRNPDCREGFVCMKDYTETTFSRDQTVLCQAYEGGENETAAQIINKVSTACGVSAEALLVLIQKEQSLVTLSAPSATRFERATGYACPDTAPCDERYYGFYNQVYNAAKQFKRYSNPPGTSRFFTWFPVGTTAPVRYHPNAACGTTPVLIRNQATAGLYYYTPYTPNAIAMANLASTGDSCSAYGNRNFWRVYNYWFNPTKDFGTWATTRDGVTTVVDREGTIATSTTLVSWQRVGVLPGITASNPVTQFGQSSAGNLAVLLTDGTAYESSDGSEWSPLVVQTTEVVQDVVTRHTVASGDTVWRISRANGVSVSSVVSENNLPRGGSLIRVGQTLTMTKRGVVKTFDSPVRLDPSIVISAGRSSDESAPDESDTPAEDSPADSESAPEVVAEPGSEPEAPAEDSSSDSQEELPALEPVVTETSTNAVSYTVARGDTLIRIAFRNTTTVSKLMADNSISNRNRIYQGQKLIVGTTTQKMTYHRAQSGDTPERIAERRSISLATVMSLNSSLTGGSQITPGTLVRLS